LRWRGTIWLARLGLVAAGLGCAFGATEGYLRWVGYGQSILRPHPVLGWSHIPSAEVTWRRPGGVRAHVKFNAAGFRDSERPVAKPQGTYRVVVLGDSMVVGKEVEREQTFCYLLEQALAAWSRRRVDVINLGVDGFATDQEYLTLTDYG